MNVSEINKNDELMKRRREFVRKIWLFEAGFSEAIYKFWCKIANGKFERRQKERPSSCVLVTKRGLHLFSNLLRRNSSIVPSKLEAYQMNCSEKLQYGQTAYYYRFMRNFNCSDCGRCFKVEKGDKKIVGKF
jgi:hypothetical protein